MIRAEREVLSTPTQLASIREFIRTFCQDSAFPVLDEESVYAFELAGTEAATNIIRHAYQGRTDQWIKIEANGYPDHVAFLFWYGGEAFDAGRVRPPAFDGSREGGFGVYIMEQCMDEVRYSQDGSGRNCIYLKKVRVLSPEGHIPSHTA